MARLKGPPDQNAHRVTMYVNLYSGLLLIGFTQASLVALLLLVRARREERPADLFAGLILLVGATYVAQWMLGFGGWYDDRDGRTTMMFYVKWNNLMAFGPLVWFYFRALVNTDFTWERRYWWHFLPALLFALPMLGVVIFDWVYWWGLSGETFTYFGDTRGPASEWENSHLSWLDEVEDVIVYLQMGVYLWLTLRTYRGYRTYLHQELTNVGPLELWGARNLLYFFWAGYFGTLLVEVASELYGPQTYVGAWPKYLAMSTFLFFAGLQFYASSPRLAANLHFDELPPDGPEPKGKVAAADATTARPPDVDLAPLAAALETRLREHEDFLDPNLRLGDLAGHLGTNSSVLSKAINGELGDNFNDYVNGYRCRAFLGRVKNGEHERHTLLSLALDCGFNSKSTFNRAFKKYAGISPAEAIKQGPDHDLARPKI